MLKASIALTYPLANARVAVSIGVADDLAALSGISRCSISVIYNPLPTRPEALTDDAEAEAVWRGWRGPRIINVGRFKAQKNHALLIRAFKRVLAEHDARLLILGTGELFEATAAVARAEGVADKVLMPGVVLNPTPYYRSSDLFVLSSDYEGFGNVIIEALACGVPVVSTNCRSGPSEILEHGRYGRLVPVGDEKALAQPWSNRSPHATTGPRSSAAPPISRRN
jgi:glycosyltransferase involved in cell wall biosynthesis